jgi:excisionase family DNA binding protein
MAQRGVTKEVQLADTKADDLLTVKEVATLCGMTHSRVCQLLRSGEMRGKKLQRVLWQVKRREAEKFVERKNPEGRPRVSETD